MPKVITTLLLVLGVGASACSPVAPTAQARPFAGGTRGVDDPGVRNNETWAGTSGTERLVATATARLVAACMHRNGFEWYVATPDPTPFSLAKLGTPDVELFTLSIEQARATGFFSKRADRGGETAMKHPPRGPNFSHYRRLPEKRKHAYNRALLGLPDDWIYTGVGVTIGASGCVSEARRRIFGDLRKFARISFLTANVKAEAWKRTASEFSVSRAVDRWRSCMNRSGFPDAQNPAGLVQRLTHSGRRPAPDAAVAHATCLASSKLRGTVRQVLTEKRHEVRRQREGEFVAMAEIRQQAVERAKEILAQPNDER